MSNHITELVPEAQPGFSNLDRAGEVLAALSAPDTRVVYSIPQGSHVFQPNLQTITVVESGSATLSQPGSPNSAQIERELRLLGVITDSNELGESEFAECNASDVIMGDKLVFVNKMGELVCSKPITTIAGQNI